ncbi:hypothetical protein H7849_19995 [Alloacidobacterium dinghuense]|uniref:Uncharacterized protein n=1 Tax=Alloacidobacterium dinghuense TaxID=2763107 RepID=A0A7G8BFM2_9BACT|nr:hypothetical protein [Alloacidobacterium dinghuense]QNI31342.1 hypothetical protein H7849_19995 [Alloacidobacterium dinghuense]
MPLKYILFSISVAVLVLTGIPAFAQQNAMPDAPKPSDPVNNTPAAVEKRKWSDIVEPGEKVPPLYATDKLLFPIHETLRVPGWFSAFASSGWEQLVDGNPKYGVDSGAYSQRFGAAAIRDLSMRTFSDGVMPALLHEDPRYYRMATGSIWHRGVYAAERVLVGQRDSGASGFNTSVVVGHGMASALTMAYYPDKSANARVVFTTWGLSLLGEAGGNLWSEFWPDGRQKLFRHHQRND